MGEDYSYPFHNTVQYFDDDELTISNLECTFSETKLYSGQQFYFCAPKEYANILLEGGVDFVTTANNHALDFGQKGLESTWEALEEYGIPYGKEDQAQLLTTPGGLTVGIYTAFNSYAPQQGKCVAAIEQLREDGAEYVICMFHWGQELYYHPWKAQIDLAHACIDAGADLIYGSHSHCLQPVEEYGDGLILYSLGNWSFGGNTTPKDMDTVIVQIRVKRDLDGTISMDGYDLIPCCVSSRPVLEGYTQDAYNDYVPTPYEEDSDYYKRAMTKLSGEYNGPEGADYSNWYASYGD